MKKKWVLLLLICIIRPTFVRQFICGSSSVGRALASQAKGHGFESRLPLIMKALIVNRLAIEVFCF